MVAQAFSTDTLYELAEGDAARVQRLASVFLRTADLAISGLTAAAAEADISAARPIGHQIKSSARWIGALEMGRLAESIELLPDGSPMSALAGLVSDLANAYFEVREALLRLK